MFRLGNLRPYDYGQKPMEIRLNSSLVLFASIFVVAYFFVLRAGHLRSLERDGEESIKIYLAHKTLRKIHPVDPRRVASLEQSKQDYDQFMNEVHKLAERITVVRVRARAEYTFTNIRGGDSTLAMALNLVYSLPGEGKPQETFLIVKRTSKSQWEVVREIGFIDFAFGRFCQANETAIFPPCLSSYR
jgi:hypothetical protein